MERMAFGVLGLSKKEFYESTFREFKNRVQGYYENLNYFQQQEWERMRFQTEILAYSTGNYKEKLKIPLPWDKETVKKSITKEEQQIIRELCDKAHGKYLDGTIGH